MGVDARAGAKELDSVDTPRRLELDIGDARTPLGIMLLPRFVPPPGWT